MKRSLYFNGEVVTMDSPAYAQAVLVEDGIIKMVGDRDELLKHIDSQTNIVNLKGNVLMPGFIDSHSHFAAYAQTLGIVQLEGCASYHDIIERLREFKERQRLSATDWIIGFGYDHNSLSQRRHPDKTILDNALPGYRILISHVSGHMGVMSSPALNAIGITENTPDPPGGKIGRMGATKIPNGYLEENAFINASAAAPQPSEEQMLKQLALAQQAYLRHGITTVQEGRCRDEEWAMLRAFSDSGLLKLDVVAYVDQRKSRHLTRENLSRVQQYKRHLKIGGYKLYFDGSPQGRTAWLSRPYTIGKPGFRGYGIYTDEQAEELLYEGMSDHMQVIVHCNGDAACEQMISCCERLTEKKDVGLRPVMIHAQLVRKDQLERMAPMGMIASFFAAHSYFWGDVHLQNLGEERARALSPAYSAKQAGVTYTFHQDTPVLMPNMLTTLWCVTNRVTRAGVELDPRERLSTYDALRGITINAAYQYFEEDMKGSIAPGKAADFVILSHNPLNVLPVDLRKIRVMQTIKNDESLYERPDDEQ